MDAPMIFRAINGVMQDLDAVSKDKYNKQQGFKYRGVDDVMNALYPAMTKNRVFVVPEILEQAREERTSKSGGNLIYSICKIRYTFFAEDGSNVQAVVIGEGMDSADKATNKAMSIAFKYACFQTFCIPTEEMVDPDADSPDENVRKKSSGKRSSGKKAAEKAEQEAAANSAVDAPMIASLRTEMRNKDVSEQTILKAYGLQAIEQMTVAIFKDAMRRLDLTPGKGGQN